MASAPTHLIMVINRDTCELKLVSAHDETEAEAAFQNLSSLFASTRNDVHKVTIPTVCGFTIGEIKSSESVKTIPTLGDVAAVLAKAVEKTVDPLQIKSTNGIKRNDRGEYVQRLADGSEIISTSDFGDE